MLVEVNKISQIVLTVEEDELKNFIDCISGLIMEKIDLNKYEPIFAFKDAIVNAEVNNKFLKK